MGVADSPIRDLVQKLRSLAAPWRIQAQNQSSALKRSASTELVDMAEGGYDCCCCNECDVSFGEYCHRYSCRSCGRVLCGACVRRGGGSVVMISGDEGGRNGDKVIKSCKSCSKASWKVNVEKVYPSVSPRVNSEPGSPCDVGKISCGNDRRDDDDCGLGDAFEGHDYELSPSEVSSRYLSPVPEYLSRIVVCRSPVRSDEDEAEDSARHFFTPSSEYYNDSSDLDVSSVSAFHESYGSRSAGSSPSESRVDINQSRYGHPVQQEKERILLSQNDGVFDQETMGVSLKHERRNRVAESSDGSLDEIVLQSEDGKLKEPLDFENNGHIWFAPVPEDEDDDVDCNYFEYDDDDDDIGGSSGVFSATSSLNRLFPGKEKHSVEYEEPMRTVIEGHFRALVSQLLEGEGVSGCKEHRTENWLDVISSLAWQSACFVKPDTSNGGSMDPVDYVKIKCIASGRPSESTLVKGVVCTKNIKHKRMTSRYGNARLLLLEGSLEYQRTSNQLASFNMLLEEEMNHIKAIVSKIEAHRPNVLLVEKSVSPYAQEYLLAKEISLVLNVKRPVLDRIAQCTGAVITTVENLPKARIGQCECFRVEKVHEELEPINLFHKRPSKTLMFFEGCPRRLGCTVLLKGSCRDELKRVKHVVQYAVFAAYHLSLETSFLADEGATLPKMIARPGLEMTDRIYSDNSVEPAVRSSPLARFQSEPSIPSLITGSLMGSGELGSPTMHLDESTSVLMSMEVRANKVSANMFVDYSVPGGTSSMEQHRDGDTLGFPIVSDGVRGHRQTDLLEATFPELAAPGDSGKLDDASTNYLSAADNHQSILVSFSSRCVVKGTVCERSRLLRIKFYGSFDKPLGRYLHDDLFDQESFCRSCKEPFEAHVLCFTHQLGSLTVNVKRLPSQKLPGERDGKIWMWHRCLKCAYVDGIPPATRRVVMSDAAWGLSFGKFLELSFSNHATANRVASCGHSLQRDCLRFYGCGNMVAFFRFSSIHILSVCLPPSMLEFEDIRKQEWMKKEAVELKSKMEVLYAEIALVLRSMEQKVPCLENGSSYSNEWHKQIMKLKVLLGRERNDRYALLREAVEGSPQSFRRSVDILELNSLRLSLLIGSRVWDHRLSSLDSHLNSRNSTLETSSCHLPSQAAAGSSEVSGKPSPEAEAYIDAETAGDWKSSERTPSPATNISDTIDSAWTGTNQNPIRAPVYNRSLKRLLAPARVYSFDSALRLHRGLPPSSMHLSTVRSFHASGDYRGMVRDPVSSTQRAYYQIPSNEAYSPSFLLNSQPSYIPSALHVTEGARLILPQRGRNNLVVAVYDDEPTSIISCALSSKEHEDWVSGKQSELEGGYNGFKEDLSATNLSSWHSFGALDLDYAHHGTLGSEAAPGRIGLFPDPKKSPHFRVSFVDETPNAGGKVKFSVTCYFARQFDVLRQKCCPSEVEFVRSLSRCMKWSAQGGKSDVYFAKSMDERFMIKQVTKTELDSFIEFGSQYFQYLSDSLSSRSPTCLAKVLGIYQVTVKHMSGGKETKMDLMVMENLFFKRSIYKAYDLKGSSRSRYISDPTGKTKVLLDLNLLEALRTNPIFLGSKAKRNLERAVWNDTAFLASIDVMDYSLLVGVDEERKELVIGIIDFMRQYTWDKHLETWVKASGILGGPKNVSPTIVSPKQYKKRFRKAMTTYFLTVPDQWSS
ncbi:putative 1-phosphatidylinositol-3-phosphate 5-kinase FAB1C [Drosera capensis]